MAKRLYVQQIIAAKACGDQACKFQELFGESTEITPQAIDTFCENFSEEAIGWCISNLLSQEARDNFANTFHDCEKEHRAVCKKVVNEAEKKNKKTDKTLDESEEVKISKKTMLKKMWHCWGKAFNADTVELKWQ